MEPLVYRLECAKAMWLFDKVSKNYLVRCWKSREARQGHVTINNGSLVRVEPVLQPKLGRPVLGTAGSLELATRGLTP